MRQRVRILGICSALVGIGTICATTAGAAPRTVAAAATKPAGYAIASATFPLPNGVQTATVTTFILYAA